MSCTRYPGTTRHLNRTEQVRTRLNTDSCWFKMRRVKQLRTCFSGPCPDLLFRTLPGPSPPDPTRTFPPDPARTCFSGPCPDLLLRTLPGPSPPDPTRTFPPDPARTCFSGPCPDLPLRTLPGPSPPDIVRSSCPFSADQMDDFSSDLFSSFFEDHLLERPLLADRASLLHMELESNPDIQAEHSYSLSEDSAPQSPALSIKMDQDSEFEWGFSQDLSAILVKEEEPDGGQRLDQPLADGAPHVLKLMPPHRGSLHMECNHSEIKSVSIKDEPREMEKYLSLPNEDGLQLPPTPPSSSHGSDSDGSLPPSSPHLLLPPSSPQPQQRPGARASSSSSSGSSSAISSSPLLTAPHKLQGSGPLLLTEEEKRTLVAEGYPVPNKLPLTKSEEKALKRVRRKIKNKISAQESRRKKKEYVECLEKKVESYTSENGDLWRKVENLETTNRSLLQQLQKLQSLVSGKVAPHSCKMASTQTGTCLMMVVLCFVLVLGSFSPCLPPLTFFIQSSSSSSSSSPPSSLPSAELYTTSQVRSRSLLFYNEGTPLEENLLTAEEEGHQSEHHSHIQTSRYIGSPQSNQTTGAQFLKRDRETQPEGVTEYF
ncbi:cyclic AMP-responsive element-binding protein 3-like protein 1 [Lampris incognitus]|uniref:cyclic AMP-responsive element-binding protein 3-like protein 1 n=1 Tax=Lampris incognitus TaxID=2546036 RepID=UPI0024B5B9FF|nr:cyclic AMP-responsive element-binding protein 3-like protein 1 [Lampris incognitus]